MTLVSLYLRSVCLLALLSILLPAFAASSGAPWVRAEAIARSPIEYRVSTFGILSPNVEDLSFQIAGRIESFLVNEGDTVTAGQPVARLETRDAADRVRAAEVQRQQAERRLERIRRLSEEGSVQQSQLEDAQDEYEQVRIAFEQARLELERCTLRAPADGVILSEYIESRTTVTPGAPIFSFQNDSEPWLADVELIDRHAFALDVGSEAVIRFAPYPGEVFRGRVSAMSGMANPQTGLFTAEITVDASGHDLRPGMVAEIDLAEVSDKTYTEVPLDALVGLRGRSASIFVLEAGNRVSRRAVTVEAIDGRRAWLSTPLGEQVRVVVRGQPVLDDGQAVSVLPDA